MFLVAAQTAYLLYASDNNQNFKISRLDANYYNVTAEVSVLSGASTLPVLIRACPELTRPRAQGRRSRPPAS